MQTIQRFITLSGIFILIFVTCCTNGDPAPPLERIVILANYSTEYTKSVNTTTEYVFVYNDSNETSLDGARINVWSNAEQEYPLIVIVKQKNGILSWKIPLPVENHESLNVLYNRTSRTLCPSKYFKSTLFSIEEYVTISITTASPTNISFGLELVRVTNFYLKLEATENVTISPAEPIYFGYNFKDQTENSSVLVTIESDDDICMTFSIQNTMCPVFDLERNIQFAGYWQTITRNGGILVPKNAFKDGGFFIVLVVKGFDTDCSDGPKTIIPRRKSVRVTVKPNITIRNYIVASLTALSVISTFCIAYIIGAICCRYRHLNIRRQQILSDEIERALGNDILSPPLSTPVEVGTSSAIDDSSLDEDDIDIMEDALSDKDIIRTKLILSVCDLARKEPKILRHKSRLYLYYLLTITIFYAAPVVQLVYYYQNVLHVTGNQDLCYYNFLCSHPLWVISDFNHVFSNFGYIFLGLLFIFLTYTREKSDTDSERTRSYGIPQHYGLFYAMGFALMMEGVMSGSYHVCPNHSNFQFDTSFMYIISVLCQVKIYQNRHPDINARAPVTYGVLALIILLGLVGVLDGSLFFWIMFTIIHLLVCLLLSSTIYYMGRWKLDGGVFRRMFMTMRHDARSGIRYLLRPMYWRRLLLLVIGNLCNVGVAIYGNMHHEKDFATYLLMVLMVNLILYTFFYIVMKIGHRERILFQPKVYIILSFLAWGTALYFFINKTISWAKTPAQSRIYNKPCILLNFFDSHDTWHFLSALAMFFSFMVLLTLDDDLIDVHRSQIPVF